MNAELFGYHVKGREMFHAPCSTPMTVVTAGLLLHIIPAPGVSLSGAAGGREASMEGIKVVADFSAPAEIRRWRPVNDGVMGGVSSGAIAAGADGTAVLEGVISLENNGGFASVRTAPRDFALDGFDGLLVRVNGGGKGYKPTARTDNGFDTVMYRRSRPTTADGVKSASPFAVSRRPIMDGCFRTGRRLRAPMCAASVFSFRTSGKAPFVSKSLSSRHTLLEPGRKHCSP